MRIYCLGPGSIGSLLCFHLRSVTPITLLLRSRQAQHRRSNPTLSIQLEHQNRTRIATGFDYEFLRRQQQQPIASLIVTTKAPHVLESLQHVRHRLSAASTVVLLHNGLGVLEELLETCFRDPGSRPTFVLATTSHGVYRIDKGEAGSEAGSHGRFCHAGVGDIRLGVLPNATMRSCLEQMAASQNHSASTSTRSAIDGDEPISNSRVQDDHPILNPRSETQPVLAEHLPGFHPDTQSLHHTLSSLLQPSVVEQLNVKWLSMSAFQTSALIKLTVNAVINPISALLETRNEALHRNPTFESLSQQICQEASAVFEAQSGEPLRPHHPLSASNLQRVVRDIVLATRSNISSMCTDIRTLATNRISAPNTLSKANLARIAASRPPIKPVDPEVLMKRVEQQSIKDASTEINYINGYICRLGRQYHIDTHVNQSLVNLIKLKSLAIKAGHVLPKLPRINRKLKINYSLDPTDQEENPETDDRAQKDSPTMPRL